MTIVLNDTDLRSLVIDLMMAETERDQQEKIGASNLSNGCDRCLANDLAGHKRANPRLDSVWMAPRLGTAAHEFIQTKALVKREILARYGLESIDVEPHLVFGTIRGYGEIGGHIDLSFPGQVVDIKSSTRKKSCLLLDFLAIHRGEEPPYGRKHKDIAGPGRGMMPEREYEAEMDKMVHKMNGYFGQIQLYMLARDVAGTPVPRGNIIWINRDGNGYFDTQNGARYDDPKAVHDVWPLSFDYNREYAEALLQRGQDLWDRLQAGADFEHFPAAPGCYVCSIEAEEALRDVDIEAAPPLGAVA